MTAIQKEHQEEHKREAVPNKAEAALCLPRAQHRTFDAISPHSHRI
jgi:hypothetical protein